MIPIRISLLTTSMLDMAECGALNVATGANCHVQFEDCKVWKTIRTHRARLEDIQESMASAL